MYEAGAILGGIIFGFPISVLLIRLLLIERCCSKCFTETGGISCIEAMCRATLFICCCGKRFSDTYEKAQENDEDEV